MKHIYTLFLLLFTLGSYSQIELEHTYPDMIISRTLLEMSGEKYFHANNTIPNAQFLIYNADHSLWKTINLPLPEDADINSARVSHISETKINPDNELEICYYYVRNVDGVSVSESRIANESGSVLLTVEGAGVLTMMPLNGYADKLFAFSSNPDNFIFNTLVFSVPELILEHTYTGVPNRIDLENSGEKYYISNSDEARIEVYNSDHTDWKTINLVIDPNAALNDIRLSETVNSDDLLELVYGTYEIVGEDVIFKTYIINEDDEVSFIVDGLKLNSSSVEGLEDKLIIYQTGTSPNSKVYSLPDLVLEHTYNDEFVSRVNLETFGEKYYFVDQLEAILQLYNEDHTPWISIDLIAGSSDIQIEHISEGKIDPNDEIELIYRYSGGVLHDQIISDQNGEILLSLNDIGNTHLSVIPGLENKFLTFYNEPFIMSSSVYSLPSSISVGLNEPKMPEGISIYPNPSSGYITLNIGEKFPENISIYSIEGKLISEIKSLSVNQIDVSFLSSGLYLLVGKEGKQTVFSKKFIVE